MKTLFVIAALALAANGARSEDAVIKAKDAAELKPAFDLSKIIRVPNTRQATDYTCCVAAMQSILAYYGFELREDDLAAELKSDPKKGTNYNELRNAARSRGLKADWQPASSWEKLAESLDGRRPTLLYIQAWSDKRPADYENDWEDGHCVVAVGYDDNNLYLMDPSVLGRYAYIPRKDFLVRWHDADESQKYVHPMMPVYGAAPRFMPEEPVLTE